MKRNFKGNFVCVAILISCTSVAAQTQPARPRILGITQVELYSTNAEAAGSFFAAIFGSEGTPADTCTWGNMSPVIGYFHFHSFCSGQHLRLEKAPKSPSSTLLREIAFAVDDVKAIKEYLVAKKIAIEKNSGEQYFAIVDPEGHRIGFFQSLESATPSSASGMRLIHAGFVVRDRAAEDRFYKDILGFHVYWHGGMKDDETNWVDMQVPDGTDWIEYMLNVPANADHHTLGVMNHIALGVPDIHAAEAQLRKNGWSGGEQPKIGRDGKWQLNLYDPDDTRVELMEFTPTKDPCCAPYTGPHPGHP
ncbi:MAG TPA: VOC family protein [Candidatus Udaeobacter sp.]|jgi:catechol 2,3-dioxygenase-like lactoylglutathione lyase family enzyme|nr:VOC family protein [Candidatus Udaeobacter sp.]